MYISTEQGPSRFSVTVVDYGNVQKLHADRVKGCALYPDQCTNQGANELRGALDYAAWNFIKRDGKVTYYAYANSDRIEGRRVQLTNPDKSRTFAAIYMHENRLYILEATVPRERAAAGALSAVHGISRQGWRQGSLCNALFECVPATCARAGRSESADGMRVGRTL